MKKYVYGVDIGGSSIKFGLFFTTGKLIETWEVCTRLESNGANILSDIALAIENHIRDNGLLKQDVEGVGLGVPGPVGPDGVVYKCVNLGWDVTPVEEILSGMLDLTVKAGNDANVAALGEMWMGGGQGYQDLVMVTLGTGVGGGIVINGKIVPGNNGAAGEIGHICVNEDETEYCNCHKKGCLEQYTSATGIVRTFKKKVHDSSKKSILKDKKDLTSKDIFDAAKAGDEISLEVADETARILGKTLANVACVINPEIFVIGGGVANAGDFLINAVKNHFIANAFHATKDTAFQLAKLGNKAGIYGSAKLLLND